MITLLLTSHEEDNAARLTGSLEMIDRLQHETDEATHELDLHLDKLLTSPMDREDIHLLSTGLRLVADFIVVCERVGIPLTSLPHRNRSMEARASSRSMT